jgi:hypothetical protein
MMLCASCATSPDQPPSWVKAECPPPKVVVDRSFKTPEPECLARVVTLEIRNGVTWGELAVDAVKASKDRDTCLAQVAAWVTSEKQADMATEGAEK